MTSAVDQSWTEFNQALSNKDDDSILKQIKFDLPELMDKQANIDQAKKAMFKNEVGQLLKLYLRAVSIDELSSKIATHEKIFKRAFGPDRFNHLKLLVRLKVMEESKKPKKGLLAG